MNDRIDVIEVLRRVNPVPLGTLDDDVAPTAGRRGLRCVRRPQPCRRSRWTAQRRTGGGMAEVRGGDRSAGGGRRRVSLLPRDEDPVEPAATTEISTPPPAGPFVGVWLSIDTDGSSQTMEIQRSGIDEHEVVVRDVGRYWACAGAPSTMTGTGRLATDETAGHRPARADLRRREHARDRAPAPRRSSPTSPSTATSRSDELVDKLRGRVAAGGRQRPWRPRLRRRRESCGRSRPSTRSTRPRSSRMLATRPTRGRSIRELASEEWWAYSHGGPNGDRRAVPPGRAGLGPVPVQSLSGQRRRRCG